MWQVAPESKIQLISCELYPKYLIGLSALKYICAIDTYIFCDSLLSVLFNNVSSICVYIYAQVLRFPIIEWTFLSKVYDFGQFVMKWSSNLNLNLVFDFQPSRSFNLLLELRKLKDDFLLTFHSIRCLKHL